MCTVTFIPVRDKIYITSNRDEKILRSKAIAPALYKMETGYIAFPRDLEGGGTWFGVHENGNAVVFLNGGWIKHIPEPPYRKSRGLILLDLIDSENPVSTFLSANFSNIEPFTALIFFGGALYEGRWDGKGKSYHTEQADHPHIWSSVTLYNRDIIKKRENWFMEWLQENKEPSWEDILLFHQFSGDGDKENDLIMNRDGITSTLSITSMVSGRTTTALKYLDFNNGQTRKEELTFSKAMQYK